MRLTVAQISLGASKKDNLDKMIRLMSENKKTSDMILFPEMCMGRKTDSLSLADMAEDIDTGEFSVALGRACAENGVGLCACLWEKSGADRVYNTAVMYDKQGRIIARYRKLHLFDALSVKESDDMLAGDELPPVFTFEGVKCSLAICYDLRFPEVFRSAVFRGAELMLIPSAWYDGELKADHLKSLLKVRALENTMFTACSDLCGGGFAGCSSVYGPYGRCVAETGADEHVFTVVVDVNRVKDVRDKLPNVANSRHDVYSGIYKRVFRKM